MVYCLSLLTLPILGSVLLLLPRFYEVFRHFKRAEGAASRLEPIALTSFAAILGLIPITLSDPLWRRLGGAIIAGLTFSGTIMLFFIPVVYYLTFKKRG